MPELSVEGEKKQFCSFSWLVSNEWNQNKKTAIVKVPQKNEFRLCSVLLKQNFARKKTVNFPFSLLFSVMKYVLKYAKQIENSMLDECLLMCLWRCVGKLSFPEWDICMGYKNEFTDWICTQLSGMMCSISGLRPPSPFLLCQMTC